MLFDSAWTFPKFVALLDEKSKSNHHPAGGSYEYWHSDMRRHVVLTKEVYDTIIRPGASKEIQIRTQ